MSTGKLKLYKGESDFKIKNTENSVFKVEIYRKKYIYTYIFAVGLEVICDIYFEWIFYEHVLRQRV